MAENEKCPKCFCGTEGSVEVEPGRWRCKVGHIFEAETMESLRAQLSATKAELVEATGRNLQYLENLIAVQCANCLQDIPKYKVLQQAGNVIVMVLPCVECQHSCEVCPDRTKLAEAEAQLVAQAKSSLPRCPFHDCLYVISDTAEGRWSGCPQCRSELEAQAAAMREVVEECLHLSSIDRRGQGANFDLIDKDSIRAACKLALANNTAGQSILDRQRQADTKLAEAEKDAAELRLFRQHGVFGMHINHGETLTDAANRWYTEFDNAREHAYSQAAAMREAVRPHVTWWEDHVDKVSPDSSTLNDDYPLAGFGDVTLTVAHMKQMVKVFHDSAAAQSILDRLHQLKAVVEAANAIVAFRERKQPTDNIVRCSQCGREYQAEPQDSGKCCICTRTALWDALETALAQEEVKQSRGPFPRQHEGVRP